MNASDDRSSKNTSAKALVDFWNRAIEWGDVNKHTGRAFSLACENVLGIDENWETRDVTEIDIEDQLRRFENRTAMEYKPTTLNAYKRRFKQAVSLFLKWVADPSSKDWVPSSRKRSPSKSKTEAEEESEQRQNNANKQESVAEKPSDEENDLFEYAYPLRENHFVYLKLPVDLKLAEVERLGAFLRTLAVDFEPNISS